MRSEHAMPIHNWTRVDAGIFHHFHLEWIGDLSHVLNRGLLPPDHYALAEPIASSWETDGWTLRGPTYGMPPAKDPPPRVALAIAPPMAQTCTVKKPDSERLQHPRCSLWTPAGLPGR